MKDEAQDPASAGPHPEQEQAGKGPERGNSLGERVRPAGREKMDMSPGDWSKTDEKSDESFPASDPPGNY